VLAGLAALHTNNIVHGAVCTSMIGIKADRGALLSICDAAHVVQKNGEFVAPSSFRAPEAGAGSSIQSDVFELAKMLTVLFSSPSRNVNAISTNVGCLTR
jgi:hypothetical protein